MLHTDTLIKMTEAEWRTLSAMALEHESSLKRRIRTVTSLKRLLQSMLADLEGVPEEVVLLRTVFVPQYLEQLEALDRGSGRLSTQIGHSEDTNDS